MTHWLIEMLHAAPKVAPDNAKCIFGCTDPAVGLFELSAGCVCHKETRQHLCAQHALKSTPLGNFDCVHSYENGEQNAAKQ